MLKRKLDSKSLVEISKEGMRREERPGLDGMMVVVELCISARRKTSEILESALQKGNTQGGEQRQGQKMKAKMKHIDDDVGFLHDIVLPKPSASMPFPQSSDIVHSHREACSRQTIMEKKRVLGFAW